MQENADPDVRRDLDEFFRRLVPLSDDPAMRWVAHTTEGPDDKPAHRDEAGLLGGGYRDWFVTGAGDS